MIIQGLSRYDITETPYGNVSVMNIRTKRNVKAKSNPGVYWGLYTDEYIIRSFSIGHLRFLMRNPSLNADTVHPAMQRIRFRPDGSVMDLYARGETRQQQCREFRDIDDVLATVLCMKEVAEGNYALALKFWNDNLELAIRIASRHLKVHREVVSALLDDAYDYYIKQITQKGARCRQIIPIMHLQVKCIKGVYMMNIGKPHLTYSADEKVLL